MSTAQTGSFTDDDLRRILREGAGSDESVDLDGDILDSTFEELGYDSLALLETGSRIEREYQITLEDDAVSGVRTPRELIDLVQQRLAARPS
ncbi:acyl carrier protein [Micromonospora sp. HM5-17]|jgi:act minimal PKS acyl carrier protein|uniref:acyl carrier protein n=1 Tax=Micromonospora sp. HM5-17 TaxID=2487710 RepID=UPI000F49B0A5|nr:acyl carrier protein [Micromonospora sp. HM5-17]ROT33849.1 acyl carrier protein [Micromonospora sp. HM5-17]